MADDLSKQEEANRCYDDEEVGMPSVYCGCFMGSDGYALFHNNKQDKEQHTKHKCWHSKIKKKMKLLGGSDQWKNFLRYRFVKFRINNKATRLQFRYDSNSYALNFDDGGANKNSVYDVNY